MPTKTPNLLLIQADQLKPQVLSGYGGAALTPNIDKLCAEGMLFENAYCNFPLCAPSRFSMLSGMLPSRIGAYDNGAEFPAHIPTMAHYLRLAKYHTCLVGKQHFVGPDMLHGFHERLVPEIYPTDFSWAPSWGEVRMDSNSDSSGVTRSGVCVRSVQIDHDEAVLYRAKAKLHDYCRTLDDGRFFMLASFTHPHEPYFCMQEYWDRYKHEDIPMPSTGLLAANKRDTHTDHLLHHHALANGDISEEHVRIARHAYLANVSYFDDMVGSLLDTLHRTGLADNTIIMLTADHGDMLGEKGLWYKKHFLDHCARVPLLIHAPAHFSAGRRSENVSLIDLLPTLCELAGLDIADHAPQELDGESLVALCQHADNKRNSPVFAEMTSEGVSSPMFMVKQDHNKLILGGGNPSLLYDLAKDPEELNNLVENEQATGIRQQLEAQAADCWDVDKLDAEIRLSQRRRRLVQSAHDFGPAPHWDYQTTDATTPWIHRGPELYNDWAWRGIE